MARQNEHEREVLKTERHHRSGEKRSRPEEELRVSRSSGTKQNSGRDERDEKRAGKSKGDEHESRQKNAKERDNGAKITGDEHKALPKTSKPKDEPEIKREDRSAEKSRREEGRKTAPENRDDKADRAPLGPHRTNAVEGSKEKASKELMCEVCEHREASLWCGDCGDILYCKKCGDADHSRGKRKEHLPLRPAEKAPQRATTKVVRCEDHGEVLRAYCETDRKAVCSLCLHIGNHKVSVAIHSYKISSSLLTTASCKRTVV